MSIYSISDLAEEAKVHGKDFVKKLPPIVQEYAIDIYIYIYNIYSDGLLYNPINMAVDDDKRLIEKDSKLKAKKKRFELRYDVEYHYHMKNLYDEEMAKDRAITRKDPKRYTEVFDRGMVLQYIYIYIYM